MKTTSGDGDDAVVYCCLCVDVVMCASTFCETSGVTGVWNARATVSSLPSHRDLRSIRPSEQCGNEARHRRWMQAAWLRRDVFSPSLPTLPPALERSLLYWFDPVLSARAPAKHGHSTNCCAPHLQQCGRWMEGAVGELRFDAFRVRWCRRLRMVSDESIETSANRKSCEHYSNYETRAPPVTRMRLVCLPIVTCALCHSGGGRHRAVRAVMK